MTTTHDSHRPGAAPIAAMDRLRLFLRPPGRGIPTLSSGAFGAPIVRNLYGTDAPKEVQTAWEDSLQRIRRVETVVVGVPSDAGAGLLRGANLGPAGVREAYLAHARYPKSTLDLGDVVCVPHLLHDDMLSPAQIRATREALYGTGAELLPVSPLSLAEAALGAVHELNPGLRLVLLGGDHSVSWPAVLYCRKRFGDDFGILQIGAQAALADHRFGIRYSHATWAHHALGVVRPERFVQVGIQRHGKARAGEPEPRLAQFPAETIPGHESEVIGRIVEHFTAQETRHLYVSVAVDAIDDGGGLTPAFVEGLVQAVGGSFDVVGADLVDVAPPLSGAGDFASDPACVQGARVLHALLTAIRPPATA